MTDGVTRNLEWDGCFNARDLGGLRTVDGGLTRAGAVIRCDALDGLTAAGWASVVDHGVRTIIDLRNPDERGGDVVARPSILRTVHLPLDGSEDREFWDVWETGPQFGTPLYYRPHLERFPQRSAGVIAAIANAPEGGVAFHCGGGRDRAGQIAMLTLALVGVVAQEIVADYEISGERLRACYAARGEPDQGPMLEAFLTSRGVTAGQIILDTLACVDVAAPLRRGGLTDADVSRLRARLLGA